MNGFGARLKKLRTDRKLSQRELAEKFNISQSAIAYYESGKKEPNHEMLQKLADFFGVSLDYLLARSDNSVIDSVENLAASDDDRPATKEDIERLLKHNPELKEMALLFLESPPGIKQAVKNILKEFKEKEENDR